ncbi:regulatory protein RecX [Microvirga terricola]|uniref:Regulatory protein RecX n=1 Tax=Microvirga terricola TaxID=2719797 RepID=A0ABX0V6X9_9HYPH|nr:RecX family transcriptional regulator [Microvirga terricola]NIX75594.1 regulatory protein RecX [Microvirga terricola]
MTDDAAPSRKIPRQVSPAYLQRAALAYLERYASSTENLRRVLRRKVEKRCRLRGEDAADYGEMIEEVVAKSLRIGLIDDTRYTEARVATLRRRGGSARAIQAKLSAKGVDRKTIAAALDGEDGSEEEAARAFARRRKLGPFRPGERAPYRDKDLAALARAGFAFDVARRIVDAELEALEV